MVHYILDFVYYLEDFEFLEERRKNSLKSYNVFMAEKRVYNRIQLTFLFSRTHFGKHIRYRKFYRCL